MWGVAWRPCDGSSILASCSGDQTVRIWEHSSGSSPSSAAWVCKVSFILPPFSGSHLCLILTCCEFSSHCLKLSISGQFCNQKFYVKCCFKAFYLFIYFLFYYRDLGAVVA